MAKKLFVLWVLLAVVLVFSSAFAEKSELSKPINFAPEGYASQYLLKPSTGYVPSLFRPTADAIVGTTWYDQQHISAMPKMIANDYQGGDKGQHFTWMIWPTEPPANRYVDYRYNKTDGNFNPGVQVDGGPWNAGYCGLDIFLNSYEAVIFHTTARQYPDPEGTVRRAKIALEKGLSPGAGTFWVYDIPESTETMEEKGMWPHGAIDSCGNIHVLIVEGITAGGSTPTRPPPPRDYFRCLAYIRCTPDGILLKCEGPGRGPYYIPRDEHYPNDSLISYLDHTGCISYIVVTDPNSKKVALVWTKWTENYPVPDDTSQCQTAQDVWYLESENCGDDWISADTFADFTFTNITQWQPNDPYRTYCDLAGVYDLEHNLHVFWNAHYKKEATDEYDPYDVSLMHWSEDIVQECPNGDTVRYSVVATRKSDATHTNPWAWNRLISKPSAGVGIPGCGKEDWLFCVWQQFDDDDMSAAGYSNGEIYFSYSTNLGLSWAAPRNITNTPDPGCDPPGNPCDSEGWPSLADRVDSSMHIQYILDRDAGIVVQDEGGYTKNYAMYKEELVCTLTAIPEARIDWTPKGVLVKPWAHVENYDSKVCTLTIRNIGTATLTGNLSETADWLSLNPTSFNIPEGPCPEIIEVTIDAGAYEETFLRDSIHITSNDAAGNSDFYLDVNVVVSDSYYAAEWQTCDAGAFKLDVGNVGNFGNQKEAGGMFMKEDSFAAIFDASLIVGFDHPDYGPKVARWMFEDHFMLAESPLFKETKPGVGATWFTYEFFPVNPLPPYSWWWPWIGIHIEFVHQYRFLNIFLIHFHIHWHRPPLWWLSDSLQADSTNPEFYVGMAVDFDLPSDTGNYWNIPGVDEDLNLIYQQGYGEETTPTGVPYDSLFVGLCIPVWWPWEYVPIGPVWGGHILPNDVYVYPDQGYRDDSLYAVMSTPGFSIRDPKGPPGRATDYNSVITFAKIPAGYLDTADVKGTFAIGVSTGGLGKLIDIVNMIQCGNANMDDAVNLGDVIRIAKYKMGLLPEPWLYMSDVNSDCDVNLGDVIHLAKYLFGCPGFDLSCECAE